MNDPNYADFLTEELKNSCYEIIRENVNLYCLSFNNPQRSNEMFNRFKSIGLDITIFEGIPIDDPRIADNNIRKTSNEIKRCWSVTYGHLTNIRNFYNSGKDFGIFCENDVIVNKNLPFFLPYIMEEFNQMNLDSLLLGYMTNWKLEEWMQGYELKQHFTNRPYKYLNYPNNLWGIHCLMLNRKGAKKLLDEFEGRADEWINHESGFSPDWTLTKIGNRALITPMFAVENGEDDMDHYQDNGQCNFHKNTYLANYISGVFV